MNEALTRDVNRRGFDSRQVHHFMKHLLTITLLLFGCKSEQDFSMYDNIIQADLHNKQTELDILRELYIAQQNNDEESFKFYVSEYVRVPRLILSDEQKQHPEYKEWITDDIIKSGEFMDIMYDYVVK